MPLLFYGPGGGGGGNGYKYPSEDVAGISYGRNADGNLTLSWSDPEDGGPAAEWKGTVVVCKEGEPPKNIDDGEIVCESAVKNQYRDAGLILDVGGPGYYYGVFPYTKDYVVNANEANVAYIPNDGYNASLENASWSDIAYISSQGIADQVWSVGDEKDIVLAGDYNGTITMQIAGFNHDNLASGGKAGITFLSKQTLGGEVMSVENYQKIVGWRASSMRNDKMPKIKGAFPADLRKVIKTVMKASAEKSGNDGGLHTTEDDVFIPSLSEVFDPDVIDKKYSPNSYPKSELAKKDGSKYAMFKTDEDVKKSVVSGSGADWWTRSESYYSNNHFFYIKSDAGISAGIHGYSKCVCFGFCI